MAPLHGNKQLHKNKFNFDSTAPNHLWLKQNQEKSASTNDSVRVQTFGY